MWRRRFGRRAIGPGRGSRRLKRDGEQRCGPLLLRRPEIGPFQVRSREVSSREVSSVQARLVEVGSLQMCVAETGPLQVREGEVGSFQMRTGEVGSLQVRSGEIGSFEVQIHQSFHFGVPTVVNDGVPPLPSQPGDIGSREGHPRERTLPPAVRGIGGVPGIQCCLQFGLPLRAEGIAPPLSNGLKMRTGMRIARASGCPTHGLLPFW